MAELAAWRWLAALGLLAILGPDPALACETPARTGCWLPPFSEDHAFDQRPPMSDPEAARYPTAVSAAVLPDAQILYFNGFEGDDQLDDTRIDGGIVPPGSNSRSRVLDLSGYLASGASPRTSARWRTPSPEDGGAGDLFCSDLKQLVDGRILAVGGTVNYDLDGNPWGSPPHRGEFEGIRDVRTFDPVGDTWVRRADMNHPRWYPSLVSLPQSPESLLVASGLYRLIYNESQSNIRQTETYAVAQNAWTDNGAAGEQSLPLYPRLHLMPNGWILYPAAGQTWNPFGQAFDHDTWTLMKWYKPGSNTWADIAPAGVGTRNVPFSLLLPLRPDPATGGYDTAQVLLAGGNLKAYPPMPLGMDLVEVVTWTRSAPDTVSRTTRASLNIARWFPSGVLLPTGEVLAINGADRDQLVIPGDEVAVHMAELYDPVADTWTELAPSARDRTYHNTAVLLADGSVLVGGHAPQPADYGQEHRTKPPGANNFRDPSFEIYQPPYLFRGPRPRVLQADAVMLRQRNYTVRTPDGDDPTLQVVLSRLPAVTHLQDADQRTVELAVVQRQPGAVVVRPAAEAAVLPRGYYYLFLLKDNGSGPTPSRARIVQVLDTSGPRIASSGTGESGGTVGPVHGLALLLLALIVVRARRLRRG